MIGLMQGVGWFFFLVVEGFLLVVGFVFFFCFLGAEGVVRSSTVGCFLMAEI